MKINKRWMILAIILAFATLGSVLIMQIVNKNRMDVNYPSVFDLNSGIIARIDKRDDDGMVSCVVTGDPTLNALFNSEKIHISNEEIATNDWSYRIIYEVDSTISNKNEIICLIFSDGRMLLDGIPYEFQDASAGFSFVSSFLDMRLNEYS